MNQGNNYQNDYQSNYQSNYQNNYQTPYQAPVSPDTYVGDPRFNPLSAWAYAGYLLLYTLVPFGWIAAIIHATNQENINRRNFARGFWCVVLISTAISVVIAIIAAILGASVISALTHGGW